MYKYVSISSQVRDQCVLVETENISLSVLFRKKSIGVRGTLFTMLFPFPIKCRFLLWTNAKERNRIAGLMNKIYGYCFNRSSLMCLIKNNVIKYKLPMLSQYTFYHWSIIMMSLWYNFLFGTISCFPKIYSQKVSFLGTKMLSVLIK